MDKNSSRRYLTVDKVFDDLKRVYADPNKMQTAMNAFTRLAQVGKFAEFHVFWNEFQRLMKEVDLPEHLLLAELKRKISYRLQNVMSSEFNTVQDIYELARLAQLKEDHYKRIEDAKSRRRPNVGTTAGTGTGAATSRTISTTTTSTTQMILDKSTAMWLLWLGGPISWKSFKQQSVVLSNTAAEYVSQVLTSIQVMWTRGILTEMGVD